MHWSSAGTGFVTEYHSQNSMALQVRKGGVACQAQGCALTEPKHYIFICLLDLMPHPSWPQGNLPTIKHTKIHYQTICIKSPVTHVGFLASNLTYYLCGRGGGGGGGGPCPSDGRGARLEQCGPLWEGSWIHAPGRDSMLNLCMAG